MYYLNYLLCFSVFFICFFCTLALEICIFSVHFVVFFFLGFIKFGVEIEERKISHGAAHQVSSF